jgi:DNA-binding NarL/FixJ family response regulator
VIRVVLADDQSLVRAGFRALLNAEPDVAVVGEATDGNDAVRTTRETVPDIVLMDIRMPGRDGLAATRDIVADRALAGVRVIVLTTFAEDAYIFEAIRSGASGFLVKDTEPAELCTRCEWCTAATRCCLPPSPVGSSRSSPPARNHPHPTRSAPPCSVPLPTANAKSSPSSRPVSPTTRSPHDSSSAPPPPRPTSAAP